MVMISSSMVMMADSGEVRDVAAAPEPVPVPAWDWNPWTTYNGTTVYHSFAEMETELFWIAENYPHITKLESIGKSWQGRDIWAMKVSDNPHVEEEDEPEIYFNANHHAREWMTIEITLYFLRYVTAHYGTNATVTDIVDNRQIWVIPSANPDGRFYDSPGDDPTNHARQDYGWRKNMRDNDNNGVFSETADGVDPNRNYGYLWGSAGASSRPGDDTYGGPYPFSEPETAAIRDFARKHNFVFAISYHTYSQLILYPWGWSYEDAPDHHALVSVANAMADVITNKAGSAHNGYIPQKSSGLYPTAGSDDDWLYGELGTFAYCIEAYPYYDWTGGGPENNAAIQPPYDLFHPRSDKVVPVCQDNLPAMMLMCKIADNRFQLIDHVEINPENANARIPAGTSANVLLDVTHNGRRADTFTISRTTLSGWTVSVTPTSMGLARNETKTATLSVTVPAGATPGFYKIWVNATSTTNASCRDSSLVTIEVPHPDDVAPITLEPFTELGDFPKGNYRIDSVVKNVGEVAVPGFNSELRIYQLGTGGTVTVFQDNMDTDASKWTIIDHDTTYSTSVWHRQTTRRQGGTHAWYCAPPGTTQYTNSAIQSLEMAQPISLERYNSATLQFYSYYATELNYDFLMVEGSRDNGKSWDYITRYHGSAAAWTLRTLDLSPFIGAEQFKVRFRFTSDDYTVGTGFYLDTLTITANDPTEAIIYGPAPLSVGALAIGAENELSWTYNFATAGTFLAEVQTLHATDGNAANNIASVMFYINNSRTLPEFGGIKSVTNPGMGTTLRMDWDPALQINDPITYRVYRFTYSPTSAQVNASSPVWTGTVTTFADSGVSAGQRYYYVVRATDSLGQAEPNAISVSGIPGISVDHWGSTGISDTFTETRYLRGVANEVTVNGLTGYSLALTNSNTAGNWAPGNNVQIHLGMRVFKRTVAGVETEISSGLVATVSRTAAGSGFQTAAWTPPLTPLATTDSIVIKVYGDTAANPTTLRATFTTGQLGSTQLEPNQWTVQYWTRVGGAPNGSDWYWGTGTYNNNIAGFRHSNVIPANPLEDNTVNWTTSGAGVMQYNIYRSEIEVGPWDAAHRIASVASDTFTYVDTGRGRGDSKIWWYVVRAVDGYGNEVTNSNAVQEPWLGVYYQVDLSGMTAPCWVLVSIPADISSNVYDLFNDALNGDGQTTWSVAKSWDNQNKVWLSHRIGGSANTLTTVDNTMSVWLWLTANSGDQKLTTPVASYFPSSSVNIQLYTGWNLVGYPSKISRLASNTLPAQADMVSEWQAVSPYIIDRAPNQVTMSHGRGYWVRVTADCVWTVQP
jgi:hypothetical protein